jgi:hypothetical protein
MGILTPSGHRRIFCVAFDARNDEIVTCGMRHMRFWTLQGHLLRGINGRFEKAVNEVNMTSLAVSRKVHVVAAF